MSVVRILIFLLCVFILAACDSSAPSVLDAPLRVQYTFAAQPWLAAMVGCAGESPVSAEKRTVDYLDIPGNDFAIRVGDADVTTSAYQIDTEEVLVILNSQNPLSSLTSEEVFGLFTGQVTNWQSIHGNNAQVQVWVFSSGEDIQELFEQVAIGHAPLTSLARLASGPEEMAQAVAADVNAVGLLSRRWMAGNVSAVYTVATAPVLILVPDEPDELTSGIISCLQK